MLSFINFWSSHAEWKQVRDMILVEPSPHNSWAFSHPGTTQGLTSWAAGFPTPSTLSHLGFSLVMMPRHTCDLYIFHTQPSALLVIISFHKLTSVGDLTCLTLFENKQISNWLWSRIHRTDLTCNTSSWAKILCSFQTHSVRPCGFMQANKHGEGMVQCDSTWFLPPSHWDDVLAGCH